MNFGSVCSAGVKLFFWGGGLILETNCVFEYKPSPHFRLDVVYKMGGILRDTRRLAGLSDKLEGRLLR